eukprot:6004661-Pyramimonas_sp.AAC.1
MVLHVRRRYMFYVGAPCSTMYLSALGIVMSVHMPVPFAVPFCKYFSNVLPPRFKLVARIRTFLKRFCFGCRVLASRTTTTLIPRA